MIFNNGLAPRIAPVGLSSTSSLLDLPVELFLCVWDLLPPYSRASLILTCRELYRTYHETVFGHWNLQNPGFRVQRLYLLRLLRKDLTDQSVFLCHTCLRFHGERALEKPLWDIDACDTRRGVFEIPVGSGFPYCNSAFTLARNDVRSRLSSSRDRGPTFFSGSYKAAIPMIYQISVDVGWQGLYMRTQYGYRDSTHFMGASSEQLSPKHFAAFARATNLELCPHLRLGYDFAPGDGSMSDILERRYAESTQKHSDGAASGRSISTHERYCTEFWCKECHVNVRIQCSYRGSLGISVWQYFNPKPLESWQRPARLDRVERPLCLPWSWEREQEERRRKENRFLRRLLNRT